jgi:hypothetical protein
MNTMTTTPVMIMVLKWNNVATMKRKTKSLFLKKTNPRYKRGLNELHAIKSQYS